MRYLIALIAVLLATFGFSQRASAQATSGLYGYGVDSGTYTSTTADWTMPSFSCGGSHENTDVAIWTGLDGLSSDTVEQIGAAIACTDGTASYYGWYDLYPEAPVYFSSTLSAGDVLDASVTYGSSKFTLTLDDVTAGWNHTVTGTLAGAARSSAETGVAVPSTLTCSGTKTLASFTDVTVDGTAMGSLDPVKQSGGDPDIVVSAISGKTFTVTCD
jgi:Peptidase A4 family